MNRVKCNHSSRQGKAAFFALTLILVSNIGFAQSVGSVSGKVVDAKTKAPLSNAIVYLANTSIGVYAKEDGSFLLNAIPLGKYDLTASMLGYKTFSQPLQFAGNTINNLTIALEPAATVLDAITVVARKEKQRYADYARFVKYFLGQTSNSYKCKIINPKDVFVYQEGDKLIALASRPIVIENRALGYRLHYELKEFSFDQERSITTFSGTPRFEELIPADAKEKEKWLKERDRAYFGSTQHFLHSLVHRDLEANSFRVSNSDWQRITEQDLIKDSLIVYRGKIFVSFAKEFPEFRYPVLYRTSDQQSSVDFMGAPVRVYDNGYFEDYHSLIFEGYIGWSSVIAEMLPLGYRPTHQLKINPK